MRRFSILHFMNIKLAVYIVVTLCLVNVATIYNEAYDFSSCTR